MTRPRKRFGQHFLIDGQVIERIVRSIAPKPQDHLVEIGPGQGALTFPLLEHLNQLEVVELDRDLIEKLNAIAEKDPRLIVHASDVLNFDFSQIKTDERPLRVVGNLPYNISTPLIFHLLQYAGIISDMVFMLQKEVAERLAAQPGTEYYGRLSIMTQYYCKINLLFDVLPTAFYPPPQVTSSILRLQPYAVLPYPVNNFELFSTIVRQAFGQRRKTLRNSLKDLIKDDVWEQIDIRSDQRPETLSVKDFVNLANLMDENS